MAFARSELEPFRLDVVPKREEVRVCPVGELDLATVPRVDAQLAELWSLGFARLVLDLREVCFLDSSGLRMCSRGKRRAPLTESPSASSRVRRWSNGCSRSRVRRVI